jgi:putative molybdopterin biosynthesis protein
MSAKRTIYLSMKTLEEARDIVLSRFGSPATRPVEQVPVPAAVGRVLAEPVVARLSCPNFHAAAMDGIAVAAADTFGASETAPRELVLGRQAFAVNTGHVLPPGTDAVIMIEHVRTLDETRVVIEAPAFPWQHVRRLGEDIVATELLFARNHRISPYCIGALLAGGVTRVPVWRTPRVAILPTGSELVDWQSDEAVVLQPGQVLESNSYVLGALIDAAGGSFSREPFVRDELPAIRAALQQAVAGESELVLTVGGSSAGSEDFTRQALADLGEVLVHGVTMMPGKPVVVGAVAGKPVFGMPGYPVSSIVACEQLVLPLLARWLGMPAPERERIEVYPTRKIPSRLGMEEFVRVKLGRVGHRVVATPLPRGAGTITSLTQADGIIRIPTHIEGVLEDQPVSAELLRPRASLERTVVVVGSHDITLDVLADELRAQATGLSLSSSHVGSTGGLMAIRRRACHLAGCHLLDTNDGSYNASYIRRLLPGLAVRRVNLVLRDQGLMVLPGNPKHILGIEDLARPEIGFINRQAGSGTRILLDWRLAQAGLEPARIRGYETEEFTHMAVAAAVVSGRADVGLGIQAAARALGLEFIPVVTEQYDLVLPSDLFDTPMMAALLAVIRSPAFQRRVMALGGYHIDMTGQVLE